MDKISSEYLTGCVNVLNRSYELIKTTEEGSIDYEMYRNSCVKAFEMCVEQAAKLLRKKIAPYFSTKSQLDKLTFKDLFRCANKYSLIDENTVSRWFKYRQNRNTTAHDYGELAKETLLLIDSLIIDVKGLIEVINND